MSAAAIMAELESCDEPGSNQLLGRLAREFEHELLGIGRMPDAYVDVLVYVLSCSRFSNLSGAAQFALNAYLDSDKMTDVQRHRVLDTIRTSYPQYRSEDLLLTTADFVARRFPASTALDSLARMGRECTAKGVHSLLVALEAVRASNVLDPASSKQLLQVQQDLQGCLSARAPNGGL